MTLTFEQVKEAGRFAYQLTGGDEVPIWNPYASELAEIVPWEGYGSYGAHSYFGTDDAADNWHHLPGCDCRFCKGGRMTAADILREAGIEVPEVTAYDEMTPPGRDLYARWDEVVDQAGIALIALAKEAAKWKWVAEQVVACGYSRADLALGLHEDDITNAIARYESEHADKP